MADDVWTLNSVSLPGAPAPRLREVSLSIPPGVTAVLGPSGAGKTSLLNLLVGYERPAAGTLLRGGADAENSKNEDDGPPPVYWAPQHGGLWPHLTVREHLEAVSPPAAAAVERLLADFGLAHRAAGRPGELSQGEGSRLAVARALASGAPALVLDEPLAHVDRVQRAVLWTYVRAYAAAPGRSLVFATHDPGAALAEARHVICLREGRVLCEGTSADLYWRPAGPEEARALGEANWLPPAEAARWLRREESDPLCLRPEQLAIEEDPQGAATVAAAVFKGSVAEAELTHREGGARRRFYHRPSGPHLRAGLRVALRALALLLLLLAPGCGEDEEGEPLVFRRTVSWMLPPAGARLPAPRSVAIGPDGELVVLDTIGRVLILTPDGETLASWFMPETKVGRPEGVIVTRDGRIAVCDTHYHRVLLFNRDGAEVGRFGRHGEREGEFIYPVAIAEDPEGALYVAEYGGNDRVQKFTPEGEFLLSFGSMGLAAGHFQRPADMLWRDGEVAVADAVNNRIQIFSDEGEFRRILGGEAAPSLKFPYGLAPAAGGRLYVAEYTGGRLSLFGPEGRLLGRYAADGGGAGPLRTPWDVEAAPDGTVWVADTGNRRMVGLTP